MDCWALLTLFQYNGKIIAWFGWILKNIRVFFGTLKSTFITLVPKCNKPGIFVDFHPIALCNLLYKLISKIIANIIKPILSKAFSCEQFGFLFDRQILHSIGITQEAVHTIKQKKMKALLFKMDLEKTFDKVDLDYIRLILIQIGLPL